MAKSQARVNTGAALKSFGKAHGSAVAEQFLKTIAEQGSKLAMYLVNIVRMDSDARQAFRLSLQGGLDSARKEIKTAQSELDDAIKAGADDDQVKAMRSQIDFMAKRFNSQKVRVSEATMFARCMDKNYPADPAQVEKDYHGAIAAARVWQREQGEGSNRGRKAKTGVQVLLETAKKLFAAGKIDAEQLKQCSVAMQKAIKAGEWVVDNAGDDKVQGEPVAETPKTKHVGPTQRKERKAKGEGEGFVPAKQPTHHVPATHQ